MGEYLQVYEWNRVLIRLSIKPVQLSNVLLATEKGFDSPKWKRVYRMYTCFTCHTGTRSFS